MKLLPQLLRTTARCLARHEAQAARGPLLAAVSGGVDSSALAVVLATSCIIGLALFGLQMTLGLWTVERLLVAQ